MHRPDAGGLVSDDEAVGAPHGGGPGLGEDGLGPRQEELLSYLQGLAPVGEGFVLRRAEAMADLGFATNVVFYRALRKLILAGFVARIEAGRSHVNGRLRVLRRLEAFEADRLRLALGGSHGRHGHSASGSPVVARPSGGSYSATSPPAGHDGSGEAITNVEPGMPERSLSLQPMRGHGAEFGNNLQFHYTTRKTP